MSRLMRLFGISIVLTSMGVLCIHFFVPSDRNPAPKGASSSVKPVAAFQAPSTPASLSPDGQAGAELPAPDRAPFTSAADNSSSSLPNNLPIFAPAPELPVKGFAVLPAPALKITASGAATVAMLPIPAVLAAETSALPFTSAQRAALSAMADGFATNAGEPPPAGTPASDPRHSRFTVNAYLAANEADFLLKQRHGHQAFVRMQGEARALASP